jgi:hypothetical protein
MSTLEWGERQVMTHAAVQYSTVTLRWCLALVTGGEEGRARSNNCCNTTVYLMYRSDNFFTSGRVLDVAFFSLRYHFG